MNHQFRLQGGGLEGSTKVLLSQSGEEVGEIM